MLAQTFDGKAFAVGVVGVFDQQPIRGQRQAVDEAIAVQLIDGGVHHDGFGEAVGAGEAHLLAEKFLIAEPERRIGSRPPGVDHRAGGQGVAIGEDHAVVLQPQDLAAQQQALGWQARAQHLMEALGADAGIAATELPLPLGEAHLVARPAVGDQGRDPGMLGRGEVWLVEGPGVIATQARAGLHQAPVQLRAGFGQAQGEQSPGQATPDDQQVRTHDAVLSGPGHPPTVQRRWHPRPPPRWARSVRPPGDSWDRPGPRQGPG